MAVSISQEASAPPPTIRGLAAAAWYGRYLRDPIGSFPGLRARYGDLFALSNVMPLGARSRRFVFALGPEYNRSVLSDPEHYHATGQTLPGPRGSPQRRVRFGLTRTRGERHAAQRALLLPMFQRPAIRSESDAMVDVIGGVLAGWAPGRCLDAKHEMRRMMLRVSSEVLFGRDDPERSWHLGEEIEDWLAHNFQGRVWLALLNLPGTPYRRMLEHAGRVERGILAMIEARRASGADGRDIVSMLIRARDERAPWMKYRDLVGQLTMLFLASYETTASAMTWTLLLLAQHPQLAEDLADELAPALRGGAPSLDGLEKLPLLDAVLRESMRIFPPVPYAIRLARGVDALGAMPLDDRDRVIVSHYVTHHMPELYPDPERFDPTRWFGMRRSPYEYLPFSAGPRTCIGINFANAAMKLALAMILGRYRFAVEPGTRVDRYYAITLASRGALPMRLHAPGAVLRPERIAGNVREMVRLPD